MISVAIIGILAAIAMPAYDSYITKSKIKAAQADLVGLSLAVENIFQKQLSYPEGIQCLLSGGSGCAPSSWKPSQKDDFSYSYSRSKDGTSYTVTATGTSTKVEKCKITLTSNNERKQNCVDSSESWL